MKNSNFRSEERHRAGSKTSTRGAVALRTPSQRTEHAAALRTQPPKIESLTAHSTRAIEGSRDPRVEKTKESKHGSEVYTTDCQAHPQPEVCSDDPAVVAPCLGSAEVALDGA